MGLSEKLKLARELAGLTQEQGAQRTGIDNSTISKFENGQSEPRMGQLEKLADAYHVPLKSFFEETPLIPQAVLWRDRIDESKFVEGEFLVLCRQYHQLEGWTNQKKQKKIPDLDNGEGDFRYPQAQELANESRQSLGLGTRPGESLLWVLEEVYGIKIFFMDIETSGSAACAISNEFGEAILLNGKSSRWRRNFDLAHELFHLLTWKRFKHDQGLCCPTPEEEKLATCFAGNLLLPHEPFSAAVGKSCDQDRKVSFEQMDRIAREFDVSLEAVLWRMHFLFRWQEECTLKYIEEAKRYIQASPREKGPVPPKFPERYRALAIMALQKGEISLGRFAKFLQISRTHAEQFLTSGDIDYAKVPTSFA